MEKFLWISAGAVLGANLRYWVGEWAANRFGSGFPYGTLIVNLSGSLLVGFIMTIAAERLSIDPRWRLMLVVGFLGAYTTFSAYTSESYDLVFNGQWLAGLSNLVGSTVMGILAVILGVWLAKVLA